MFKSGLIDETLTLLDQGLRGSPTASKATGYAEAIDVIDERLSIPEAIESVALHTRRLAKKQRTWFRPDPRIAWIDVVNADIDTATNQARELIASAREEF